jgi:hypothetical protein
MIKHSQRERRPQPRRRQRGKQLQREESHQQKWRKSQKVSCDTLSASFFYFNFVSTQQFGIYTPIAVENFS